MKQTQSKILYSMYFANNYSLFENLVRIYFALFYLLKFQIIIERGK